MSNLFFLMILLSLDFVRQVWLVRLNYKEFIALLFVVFDFFDAFLKILKLKNTHTCNFLQIYNKIFELCKFFMIYFCKNS